MKKKLILLLSLMLLMSVIMYIVVSRFNNVSDDKNDIKVVTSFYPVYILTLNLTDQVPGVSVESLTDFSSGCLHDYQLTTDDMKSLSEADVFIINGGGMEEYLSDVIKNYPDLTVIDLSEGIAMLDSLEHEGEKNPHVWLDPDLYMKQIENGRRGLLSYIKNSEVSDKDEITEKINSNARVYTEKVEEIAEDVNQLLNQVRDMAENEEISNKVIIFHESFAYLAEKAGLNVAFSLEIDNDTPLSAGRIAEIIDIVKRENIRYLFAEKQYRDTISDRIREETGAGVYVIDSAVTGEADKDSYLNSMRNNIKKLEDAFEGSY